MPFLYYYYSVGLASCSLVGKGEGSTLFPKAVRGRASNFGKCFTIGWSLDAILQLSRKILKKVLTFCRKNKQGIFFLEEGLGGGSILSPKNILTGGFSPRLLHQCILSSTLSPGGRRDYWLQ